jgi:NitT/TauT family transport system substrate-binding protein
MPLFHKSLFLLLLAVSQLAWSGESITIMVSGIDKQIYLPAKLAEQLGYLRESGLQIELKSEPAGSTAEKEMLLGAAQGVVGFYDHTISLQARGKLVQSVVQFSHVPGEAIVVATSAAADIRTPADFRNQPLGVTGLGASTNYLTRYIAAQAGVKGGELRILPVGAGATFIEALKQGRIVAGMTTEPTISQLTASGAARVLVDLRSLATTEAALGGPYPGASLYMPTAWVNAHRDEVKKIVAAFVRALEYISTHSAEEIAARLPESYHAPDRRRYVEALAASKGMFSADGLMPENGPPTVLKVIREFDKAVRDKPVNLANTYTNVFVATAREGR